MPDNTIAIKSPTEEDIRPVCSNCSERYDDNHFDCGVCDDCCSHAVCATCERRRVNRGSVTRRCHASESGVCRHCELCPDHCECVHCENCGNECTDEYCGDCNNCSECCGCIRCNHCGDICNDNHCIDCVRCSDCCRCEFCEHCNTNLTHVSCDCTDDDEEYDPGSPIRVKSIKERRRFNCTRLVGVEWEYNKSNDESVIKSWADKWGGGRHHDGSCRLGRDSSSGWELVTPPIAGDHIIDCLTDLGNALAESGTRCNHQCGIHVHVDAADLRWQDMYRLLYVYSKVEPLLYLLAGQHRLANEFCEPIGRDYYSALNASDKKEAILFRAISSAEIRDTDGDARSYLKRIKKPGKRLQGRYRGLNIVPWIAARSPSKDSLKRPDCTVEFRIHRNTLDAARVIGWTKLVCRLVDYCAKATDKDVAVLPKSAIRTLIHIAPDCKSWILQRIKEWRVACRPMRSIYATGSDRARRRIKFMPGGIVTYKELDPATEGERDTA